MGAVIEARCACGFESGRIYAGGGFQNFEQVCAAPALCMKCRQFVIKNYKNKYSKCPTCNRKLMFYNDSKLQAPKDGKRGEYGVFKQGEFRFPDNFDPGKGDGPRDVFVWGKFRLPDVEYLCPKCGKMTMEFSHVGDWD
jgi:DNA-directed RNA polymerase subunit RPC12/RpoP